MTSSFVVGVDVGVVIGVVGVVGVCVCGQFTQ